MLLEQCLLCVKLCAMLRGLCAHRLSYVPFYDLQPYTLSRDHHKCFPLNLQ